MEGARQLVVPSVGKIQPAGSLRLCPQQWGSSSLKPHLCCLGETPLSFVWGPGAALWQILPSPYPPWPSLGGCWENDLLGGPTALMALFLLVRIWGPKGCFKAQTVNGTTLKSSLLDIILKPVYFLVSLPHLLI